ncbi:hypothetical protein RI367_002317 [Sorochytrium milnesiophthora]
MAAAIRSLRTMVTGARIVADYKLSLYDKQDLPPDEYKKLKSEVHLRAAQRMLSTIRLNGGVYVKCGQHISAMVYLLPAEYVETMRVLQDQCQPSSMEEIRQLFRDDMQQSLDDIFASFDPVPIGVASLAQVHRATLKDGREVAIKVQHPAIRRFSELDIELTAGVVKVIKWLFPEFQFDWLADEMRINMPHELNFQHEAQNTERVRRSFDDTSPNTRLLGKRSLKIPDVYWADSRLLCMEYIHGGRIDNLDYYRAHNINPVQVSAELTRIFSEMIFVNGWLHADPHPGNILIRYKRPTLSLRGLVSGLVFPRKNFEIVLLDHGLYRELHPEFQKGYARLWRSLLRGDEAQIRYWSKEVAQVDMYHLFACMLTGRNWDAILNDIKAERVENELDAVSAGAANFFLEITQVLARVPRQLLLIFKTNDLLRSIEKALGTHEWLSASVMSGYVLWVCKRTEIPGEHEGKWRRRWEYVAAEAVIGSYEIALVWRERLSRLLATVVPL